MLYAKHFIFSYSHESCPTADTNKSEKFSLSFYQTCQGAWLSLTNCRSLLNQIKSY